MHRVRLLAFAFMTLAALLAAVVWFRAVAPRSVVVEAQPTPSSNAAASLPPSGPAIAHLVIPSIGVDHPVIAAGNDANGRMQAPDGPQEVAWYDYTAWPGTPGNAVFAGHLNWRDGSQAVFERLATLQPGDVVDFDPGDGTRIQYRVVAVEQVDAFTTDVAHVLNWTASESLTLLTCGGEYVWEAASYAERTVVRAERVPSS